MKKAIKKAIVLFAAAVLLCGIFTGCFNQESSTGGADNVTTGASDTGSQSASDDNAEPESTDTAEDNGTAQESSPGSAEVKTDTGRYQGLIDSNSIEIKISGVPDGISARAFRLSEEIKGKIDSFGLNKDDVVKVEYILNEHNQPVIVNIEKIGNAQ